MPESTDYPVDTQSERQALLDTPTAVIAAAYLSGLNMLVVNLQPLILGALADSYGLSDRQLGHISAIFVGFATACSISGPFWVRRVDWRNFSRLVIVLAILTLASGALLTSPVLILALFAVLGLLKGSLGIPAFASLGDSSNPDRNYGVSIGFQAFLSAAVTIPAAAWVIPRYGVSGLFTTLAAIIATGILICAWLPRSGLDVPTSADSGSRGAIFSAAALPAWIALLSAAAFTGGILGFWYFIERIGVERGVGHGLIGVTLSLCSLATIVTAAIVAWLGGRLSSFTFVGVGTLLLLFGFGSLQFAGSAAYIAGALGFALGWGMAQPAYYAVLRKVDVTGRLFVAAPAASGLAGVTIGIVAGPIIEAGGYAAMIMTSAILVLVAAGSLLASQSISGRAAPGTASAVAVQ